MGRWPTASFFAARAARDQPSAGGPRKRSLSALPAWCPPPPRAPGQACADGWLAWSHGLPTDKQAQIGAHPAALEYRITPVRAEVERLWGSDRINATRLATPASVAGIQLF